MSKELDFKRELEEGETLHIALDAREDDANEKKLMGRQELIRRLNSADVEKMGALLVVFDDDELTTCGFAGKPEAVMELIETAAQKLLAAMQHAGDVEAKAKMN